MAAQLVSGWMMHGVEGPVAERWGLEPIFDATTVRLHAGRMLISRGCVSTRIYDSFVEAGMWEL